MSLHFSANQYDQAFDPKLLQNWEVPSVYRQRPRAFDGFTQIVANNRGHLLKGVKRSRESPWGNFVGTYDMPLKIPGNNMTNSTARTFHAMQRLQRCKTDGDIILSGKLKRPHVPDPLPVKLDKKADEGVSSIPPAPIDTLGQGVAGLTLSGGRSGAVNPEPVTQLSALSPKPLAPISPKPASARTRTPLDWPRPGSGTSPVLPNLTTNAATCAAVAGSPKPTQEAVTAEWPSPKSVEPPQVA